MSDTPAVATAIFDGIIGQADLITSLSLVVMSGLPALMIQWKFGSGSVRNPAAGVGIHPQIFVDEPVHMLQHGEEDVVGIIAVSSC